MMRRPPHDDAATMRLTPTDAPTPTPTPHSTPQPPPRPTPTPNPRSSRPPPPPHPPHPPPLHPSTPPTPPPPSAPSPLHPEKAHWAEYGRNYYARYDYEGVEKGGADKMMAAMVEAQPSLIGTTHGTARPY